MKVPVTECMAPSETLSKDDASIFGSTLAEVPIILDYLAETHGGYFTTVTRPTATDWWDVEIRPVYWAVLLDRHHPQLSERRLRAEKNLVVPDLTTYKGKYIRRSPAGEAILVRPGDRNEFYEIKPNSRSGRANGPDKLTGIHAGYRRLGIDGIYTRGTWYPEKSPRRLNFRANNLIAENFLYLMKIINEWMNVQIRGVYLEVEREVAGLLLYKICIEFDREDHWTKEMDGLLARYIVRTFFKCLCTGLTLDVKKPIMAFANTLQPTGSPQGFPGRIPAIFGGRDLNKVPSISVRSLGIVPELEPMLQTIGDVLYTRLKGLPGQEYIICCDETYLRTTISEPRRQRMQATVRMLSSEAAFKYSNGRTMLALLPASSMTAIEVLKGAPGMAIELLRYAADHPKESIIFVGIVIAVTALVAITLASGGAAPAAAAAGAALVEGAETVAVGTTLVEGAGTAAAGEGALASGMAAPIMAEATAPAIAAATAVPESVPAAVGIANPLLQMAREIVAEEMMKATVRKILTDAVATEALKVALPVAAGALLLALSARPAFAAPTPPTSPSQPAKPAAPGQFINMPVGRLFAVRAGKQPAYGYAAPKLEEEFDFSKHTDDFEVLTRAALQGSSRAYYLGRIKVE
jgi:hypothetical protein